MKVVLSGVMIRFADYQKEIAIDAEDIASALNELTAQYPALKKPLLDAQGQIRSAHRLFLNGEAVVDPRSTALKPDDSLEILTAVAGG